MEWISQPETWIAFFTLVALELVLGVDNVIFISILAGKLPMEQRSRARTTGIALAVVTRILLLLSLSWVISLDEPFFTLPLIDIGISGRDLILLAGGLFLLWKSTHEIHEKLEGVEGHASAKVTGAFWNVIIQIMLLDIVFSLDSVITAVGMVDEIGIMVVAVIVAAGAPAAGFGEPAPAVLRVEDAVMAALRNNLSVKAATMDERAKKLASDLSFNRFFPSLSVQGTALRLNQTTPSLVGVMGGNAIYMTPDRTNLAFGLTIQEVFNPTFFVLMNQAALAYKDSAVDRAQAERTIAAAAKKAFYQLIVQKRAIDLTRSRLEKAEERRRQAEVSFQIGQTSELNSAYASQNVEGIMIDLRGMETASKAALTHFEQLLGFDTREDMELSGDLDVAGVMLDRWDGLEARRLDVRKAELAVRQLENGLHAQDTALLPSLIFQYKLDPTLNGPTADNIFKGGNWVQPSGGLSLTLSWDLSPILPGSDYRVKLSEYNARLGLARESEALTLRAARDDTEDQKRELRASMDNLESLGRVLESAKRAYDLTEASYKAGSGRLLDLQDAELAWQGANLQILNEKLKLMAQVFDRDAKYATTRE